MRDLAVVIHDLSRRLRMRSLAMAQVGALTPTAVQVLDTVVKTPGLTVREIAAQNFLQRPNTSTALAELERSGLVIKEADPRDRRLVHIQPTPEAVAGIRRIEESWALLYAQALDDLPPEVLQLVSDAVPALQALDRQLALADSWSR